MRLNTRQIGTRPLPFMLSVCLFLAGVGLLPLFGHPKEQRAKPLRIEVSFSREAAAAPLDGRVLLLISTDGKTEPRQQFFGERTWQAQQIFGVDAEALQPDQPAVFDGSVLGFPMKSLNEIPAGDYFIQAILNRYTTFHRSDGHSVKLPRDEGEGQRWSKKPGNPYSDPIRVHIDPKSEGTIRVRMTRVIPRIEPPADTKYVKHLRMKSELLSKFWGEPVYLGAIVLLPEGWDGHPDAHYPLMIEHDHFTYDFHLFSEKPPDATLKGNERTDAEYAYKFYQDWTSGRLPRVLLANIQHPTPYYDDSYAVNSANEGPYGDAITQELIPYLEKQFRGIGQGWARAMFGDSTGGWESLGEQIFYPDFFNGAWACCPDPVDFHAYQIVNLYSDQNAFWRQGPWGSVPQPDDRDLDGRIDCTMEQVARLELVLGTHGRSTRDNNSWQAVFGPVGPDGYPKQIWDPATGVIDHEVAAYWRDHYDLRYILERDWKTLGPKLAGKIHIVVGSRDTFYLDNAVRMLQQFLESTNDPYYAGYIKFGPHQPHGYSEDPHVPGEVGYLVERQRVLPEAVEWMLKSAPAGADVSSWRY